MAPKCIINWFLIFIISTIVNQIPIQSIDSVDTGQFECPKDSLHYGYDTCIKIEGQRYDEKYLTESFYRAFNECRSLGPGWYVLRMDLDPISLKKLLLEIVLQRSKRYTKPGVSYIWINLRREQIQPNQSRPPTYDEWSDRKRWHWQDDTNDTLMDVRNKNVKWRKNQPDNFAQYFFNDLSKSELCVLARIIPRVNRSSWLVEWHDILCEMDPKDPVYENLTQGIYTRLRKIDTLVCEKQAEKVPPKTPFWQQWWFIMICAVLALVTTIALGYLIAACWKRSKFYQRRSRRRRRRGRGQHLSDSSSVSIGIRHRRRHRLRDCKPADDHDQHSSDDHSSDDADHHHRANKHRKETPIVTGKLIGTKQQQSSITSTGSGGTRWSMRFTQKNVAAPTKLASSSNPSSKVGGTVSCTVNSVTAMSAKTALALSVVDSKQQQPQPQPKPVLRSKEEKSAEHEYSNVTSIAGFGKK